MEGSSGGEMEALRRRLDRAERSSAQKSRFIRHVSHEFRTPLGSIIGYAALLEREGERLAPEVRAEYLGVVLRNARHLLHVVNDLLNISKVEAGTLEITLAPVRAQELISSVVVALGPQSEERGLRLRVVDGGAPPVRADSGRLRQVLFNLLENAIKYSPPGSDVEVRTVLAPGGVRVEVEDRGPGISAADQGRLFREFSRVTHPGMRVVGAGLGLALSRMLTEAMGGSIGVESEPGRGSTFWLELPAAHPAPSEGEAAPDDEEVRRRRGTVAVVEDDPDLSAYARAVLQRAGYTVVTDDGAAGLGERVAAAAPDVVLLDLHLGERSGRDALAELRAQDATRTVPVLAFTAGEIAPGQDEGFAGTIGKPVEPGELIATVDAALDIARGAPGAVADFLAPLRDRFRTGLTARAGEIRSAIARGDLQALARETHKLRGAAGGYGFPSLAAAAAAAEEAGSDGTRRAAVERLLEEIAGLTGT
jgi:DNA-binding response OmpR family regulator/anti-sigma regulatory factor (Ser/Thr protein kinase)